MRLRAGVSTGAMHGRNVEADGTTGVAALHLRRPRSPYTRGNTQRIDIRALRSNRCFKPRTTVTSRTTPPSSNTIRVRRRECKARLCRLSRQGRPRLKKDRPRGNNSAATPSHLQSNRARPRSRTRSRSNGRSSTNRSQRRRKSRTTDRKANPRRSRELSVLRSNSSKRRLSINSRYPRRRATTDRKARHPRQNQSSARRRAATRASSKVGNTTNEACLAAPLPSLESEPCHRYER